MHNFDSSRLQDNKLSYFGNRTLLDRAPVDSAGVAHTDLVHTFNVEKTEKPLRRDLLKKLVLQFVEDNRQIFFPILIKLADAQNESELNYSNTIEQMVAAFQISSGQLQQFGLENKINIGTEPRTFEDEIEVEMEYFVTIEHRAIVLNHLILAALTHLLEVHTSADPQAPYTRRFFLKPLKRYLCGNDFGMRKWDDNVNKFTDGSVTDLEHFSTEVRSILMDLTANIKAIKSKLPTTEEAESHSLANILSQPTARQLVYTALPPEKAISRAAHHGDRIAKSLGIVTQNPQRDYEVFKLHGKSILRKAVTVDASAKYADLPFSVCWTDQTDQPVIMAQNFELDSWAETARNSVLEYLAIRALQGDQEMYTRAFRYLSPRGTGSNFYYSVANVYEFFKTIGTEKSCAVLAIDDRQISEQMTAFDILRKLDFDLDALDAPTIKWHLVAINNLLFSGVWGYLKRRDNLSSMFDDTEGDSRKVNTDWLLSIDRAAAQNLFKQGKRMYWVAKQIWTMQQDADSTQKFYKHHYYISWDQYDLDGSGVDFDTVRGLFQTDRELMNTLMSLENDQEPAELSQMHQYPSKVSLKNIVEIIKSGKSFNGVTIARDKTKYLERRIKDQSNQDDLELALSDWPDSLKAVLTTREIELYFEHAHTFMATHPKGLASYARAKQQLNPEILGLWTSEPVDTTDLDVKINICNQSAEVLEWYKSAVLATNINSVHKYLHRTAYKNPQELHLSYHDSLLWARHGNDLSTSELIAVLETIDSSQTAVDFSRTLPRYSSSADPFKHLGDIHSIRELKKRVIAIESKIDLQAFPEQVQDIVSAPGFNVAALDRLRNSRRSDFEKLVSGVYDTHQPFAPRQRVFATEPLSKSIKTGLGSLREGITGTAKDPKALFHELKQLIKDRSYQNRKMEVGDLFEYVPLDLEQDIISLLEKQRVDVGIIVEATVHAKSDPEGWVCGNYTDCCMPFGDPYNDDYMFNKGTQYFTVKYAGRIIAQSVVVDGYNVNNGSNVVILDNIEVAKNYKHLTSVIDRAYRIFWAEYTTLPVKIGTANSDLIPSEARLELNRVKPKHQLGYSDSRGTQIYDLPKVPEIVALDETVVFSNISQRDVKMLAQIERDSYPPEMVQGPEPILQVINRTKELDLPGAVSSFVVYMGKKPVGYLLALPEQSEVNPKEIAYHIYDMVILPEFRGKGIAMKMMERILHAAKSYAGSFDNFHGTIEAEARESTSYSMITNPRVQSWIRSYGFKLTNNQVLSEYLGSEDFHLVRYEYVGDEPQNA